MSSPDGSQLDRVEGFYQVTGFCDNDLYGIAEPSGKYSSEAQARDIELRDGRGYTGLMLNQLTTDSKVAERNVALRPVDSSDQGAGSAPCRDDVLYYLASVYSGESVTIPMLRSWDIQLGEMSQFPLVDRSGAPIVGPQEDTFEVNGVSRKSLEGSNLDWVDDYSRVWRTDVETGRSAKLFDLQGEYDSSTDTRVSDFTDSSLIVLTYRQEEGELRLVEYDRDTGETIRDMGLPEVAKRIDDKSVWSVAARQ